MPTYNELDNIKEIIPDILNRHENLDILIVDDNSPDGTGEYINKLSQRDNRIHFISRPAKMGLGTAYVEGFKFALKENYDLIFEMDADYSHDPKEIKKLLQAAAVYDLVIGSRYIKSAKTINWPKARLLLSRFGNFYARITTRLPVRDATSGFRCFKKKVIESLDFSRIKSNGFAFQIEIAFRVWKNGFKIGEIPITFTGRKTGDSKLSLKIIIEGILTVWNLKHNQPL